MSTTDPGANSPTTVGSRPGGAEAPQDSRPQTGSRPQRVDTPRGSAPVRTTTSHPTQARPGQAQPAPVAQPSQASQVRQQPAPGPGQARPGQPRPGQARTGQPGQGQPRPGQARAGQPGPGQPRPGQPRPVQPRTGQPGPAGRVTPAAARRGPRKAQLSLARLDPWSVLKLAFLLSVALGIIGVVVTAVVWNVIDGMGVFTDVNDIVAQVQGDGSPFNIYAFVGFERMLSLSVVIAVVNVFILTSLATLFAFVYNISSGLVGGLHVTLTDE